MFGAPFEGKDSEYGECSHPFPFFGMSGKTGEQGAPQALQNITTSAKSAAPPSSTISTSTTTTTSTASTLSGRTPEANGGGDEDQASTLQPSSNRTGRIGSDSGSAAFPGINDNTKDALYPHRLCNGKDLIVFKKGFLYDIFFFSFVVQVVLAVLCATLTTSSASTRAPLRAPVRARTASAALDCSIMTLLSVSVDIIIFGFF